MTKKRMEPKLRPEQRKAEVRKPLAPEQYAANNRTVFNEIKRRSKLESDNPERLALSPVSLRALELYTTEISLIPRGPHNKVGMIGFFSEYTDQFNTNSEFHDQLAYHVDRAGNVFLRMAARGGEQYDKLPEIDFQGHYDLVSAAKDGYPAPAEVGVALQLQEIPDKKTGKNVTWMSGIQTSAGIDCAWGVSLALAQMEAIARSDKPHPAVGKFITPDEEVGLLGAKAFGFTADRLTGNGPIPTERYLLNVDNDKLNGLVGSAGLVGSEIAMTTQREPLPEGFTRLAIAVLGSQSGHSGDERDRVGNGRWNKITEATEMVQSLREQAGLHDIRLIAMEGGEADNAIPMEVRSLVLAVPQDRQEEVLAQLKQQAEKKNEQAKIDFAKFSSAHAERAEDDEVDVMTIKQIEETDTTASLQPMTHEATAQALSLLDTLNPDGVLQIEWNVQDPEAIDTSSNLSLVYTDEQGVHITILSRSSKQDQLGANGIRATAIKNAVESLGATYADLPELAGDPWEPNFDDPIVKLQEQAAQKVLPADRKFKVTTIHAGVEVKTLRDKFWEIFGKDFVLHAASNGPKYKGAHSFNERAPIESMEDFAQFEAALFDEIVAYELAKQGRQSARRG